MSQWPTPGNGSSSGASSSGAWAAPGGAVQAAPGGAVQAAPGGAVQAPPSTEVWLPPASTGLHPPGTAMPESEAFGPAGLAAATIRDAASSANRLDSLASEVAAIKIRGGRTRFERQVRVGGTVLMAIGVVLVAIAWLEASAANTSVNNQLAYLMSGGLIGLALVGIGCAVYLRSWMARQRYWQARQVVENRELTGQLLELLARIEKLLGGTGEIPGATSGHESASPWETITSPPGREEVGPEPLVGDPSAIAEPLVGDPSAISDTDTSVGGGIASGGDAEGQEVAYVEEEMIPEDLPVYTNEHGHVWDHSMNQWYDPESHQWFDGIADQWYARDAPPPPF